MTAISQSSTVEGWVGTVSPWMSRWVPGGSEITLDVFLAHNGVGDGTGGALQTDQIWLEVQGPSDANPATAQGHHFVGRPAFNATPTDLASDGSTWTGTGVGTKHKLSPQALRMGMPDRIIDSDLTVESSFAVAHCNG